MANSPTTERELFSDFYTNLTEHPVSKDLARKTNEDAVKQSIRNLILTDPGERPFQPDLGGGVNRLLFENITPQTSLVLKENIKTTINNYEPRCELLDVLVVPKYEENEIFVRIVFRTNNTPDPVNYDMVLTRVR